MRFDPCIVSVIFVVLLVKFKGFVFCLDFCCYSFHLCLNDVVVPARAHSEVIRNITFRSVLYHPRP